jgi:type VI protein secretion system component VasK
MYSKVKLVVWVFFALTVPTLFLMIAQCVRVIVGLPRMNAGSCQLALDVAQKSLVTSLFVLCVCVFMLVLLWPFRIGSRKVTHQATTPPSV